MATRSYKDIGAVQRPETPPGLSQSKSDGDTGAVQTVSGGGGSSAAGPLSSDSRLLSSSLTAGRLVT